MSKDPTNSIKDKQGSKHMVILCTRTLKWGNTIQVTTTTMNFW